MFDPVLVILVGDDSRYRREEKGSVSEEYRETCKSMQVRKPEEKIMGLTSQRRIFPFRLLFHDSIFFSQTAFVPS